MNTLASADFPQMVASNYAGSAIDFSSLSWGSKPEESLDFQIRQLQPHNRTDQPTEIMANPSRRIVQVFIADPNENVPLENSVIYRGEQKLTDLNDQELFFELPISESLKKHNDFRVTCIDKESTKRAGKDVHLDAAKIRDLKMVVVTVAQF